MRYTVITAPITLLATGFWLAQPGVSQEQLVAEIDRTQRSNGRTGG
jgi:hypothetical protein